MPIVRYTPPTLNIYCRRCGEILLAAPPPPALAAHTAVGFHYTVVYSSLGGNCFVLHYKLKYYSPFVTQNDK